MNANVFLDDELASEVKKAASLIGEGQDTVLRMAIRAGLPVVASSFQAPRPDGYFKSDYDQPDPEREQLEEAMSKVPQTPDR
jgi:hypothetical protein